MRALLGGLFAIAALYGRADGQSGTIVYASEGSLDVELPSEMVDVRELLEARSGKLFDLHFTPSRSLMIVARTDGHKRRSDGAGSPAQFPLTNANLDALTRVFEAWWGVEATGLLQAYVESDGSSGVKLLRSISGERFRVPAAVASVEWRVTGQRGEHVGYDVAQAVGVVAGNAVEAWFAPDIPVSAGPALYGGLPGIILVLSVEGKEGRTVFAATEVVLEGMDEGLIRVPDEGETKTQEEYGSIVSNEIALYMREFRDIARMLPDARCSLTWEAGQLKWQCRE